MKRSIQFFVALAALMLSLTACSDGKYVRQGDSIFYTYWTFSFGQRFDTLYEADAASFHSLNNWIGVDKDHVFFEKHLVPGADPATIKADHKPLMHDKNDYYYGATAMHVADMKSFKVVKWIEDDFYARDSRYAYFDTLRFEPDLASFKVKTSFVAVDKNHVYRFGRLLPLADPSTYQEMWDGFYSRDKSHIWFSGTLLEDADYATFTVDGDFEAHDKFGRFNGDKRVTGEEEEPAEPLPAPEPEPEPEPEPLPVK